MLELWYRGDRSLVFWQRMHLSYANNGKFFDVIHQVSEGYRLYIFFMTAKECLRKGIHGPKVWKRSDFWKAPVLECYFMDNLWLGFGI